MSQQNVENLIQKAQGFVPEGPRPLMRELPPSESYPVDALGSVLENAAHGIFDIVQAPLEICCQSVLAVATLATQAYGNVKLPIGQVKPLSGYFISIAETGERKSSCDAEALKPIEMYERTLRENFDNEHQEWCRKKEAWEAQKNQIIKDKKQYPTLMEKDEALKSLGSQPSPPLTPLLTCQEPTFEGISRHFQNGLPSLGIFSSEGGQFIGGHGMKQEEKLKTVAALCELWEGNPIKRIRAGDGTIILPGRRLSVNLMLQPDVARILLSDPLLANQGLLSRILLVAPESKIGARFSVILYHKVILLSRHMKAISFIF